MVSAKPLYSRSRCHAWLADERHACLRCPKSARKAHRQTSFQHHRTRDQIYLSEKFVTEYLFVWPCLTGLNFKVTYKGGLGLCHLRSGEYSLRPNKRNATVPGTYNTQLSSDKDSLSWEIINWIFQPVELKNRILTGATGGFTFSPKNINGQIVNTACTQGWLNVWEMFDDFGPNMPCNNSSKGHVKVFCILHFGKISKVPQTRRYNSASFGVS